MGHATSAQLETAPTNLTRDHIGAVGNSTYQLDARPHRRSWKQRLPNWGNERFSVVAKCDSVVLCDRLPASRVLTGFLADILPFSLSLPSHFATFSIIHYHAIRSLVSFRNKAIKGFPQSIAFPLSFDQALAQFMLLIQ